MRLGSRPSGTLWAGSGKRRATVSGIWAYRAAEMAPRMGALFAFRGMSSLPAHQILVMPALSPTMEMGNLAAWNQAVGDEVAAGDALADIETDKATMQWDTTDDGFIGKHLVDAPTADIPVGTPMLVLCEEREDVAAFSDFVPPAQAAAQAAAPAASPSAPAPAPEASTPNATLSSAGQKPPGFLTPAVLAAVRANPGIDFSGVAGTGRKGMILKGDLAEAIRAGPAPPAAPAPAPTATPSAAAPAAAPKAATALEAHAKPTPHFYLTVECRVDKAIDLVAAINQRGPASPVQMVDLLLLAVSKGLQEVPMANATWDTDASLVHNSPDVALLTPGASGGLTTTISLINVANMSMTSIASTRAELASQALQANGAFQQGCKGVVVLAVDDTLPQAPNLPIPPGRTLSLGMGAPTLKAMPQPDMAARGPLAAQVVQLTLACDHRVVDGVLGSQLLSSIRAILQEPGLAI